MSHGLQIRFREVAPDMGLLQLALDRLGKLNEKFRQDLLCTVIVANSDQRGIPADVSVELKARPARRRALPLGARAKQGARDATGAMLAAFAEAEQALAAVLTLEATRGASHPASVNV